MKTNVEIAAELHSPDQAKSVGAAVARFLRAPLAPLLGRRSIPAVRPERLNALYNRGGLLAHGEELLGRCRAAHRDLTLAVFDCNDLLEARTIYGARTSRLVVDSIVRKIATLAGPHGLAARTGPTQFCIALPVSRDKAVQAIERVLGNPARFELEGSRSELVLVPHVMVEAVPAAGTVERMFAALCRGLTRTHEEERMRDKYLQRERERHSRPMPIRSDDAPAARPAPVLRLEPDRVFAHQVPNTIPMPLPAR